MSKRPAPVNYIEERGTGGVGDFGGEFTGQPEANVVLREQDLPDALKVLRFVIAHP